MHIKVFGHSICGDNAFPSHSLFIFFTISSVSSHSSSSSASGPQSICPSQCKSLWIQEQLFEQKNSVGRHFKSHSITAVPELWWLLSSIASSVRTKSSVCEYTVSCPCAGPPGKDVSTRLIPNGDRIGSWMDGTCIIEFPDVLELAYPGGLCDMEIGEFGRSVWMTTTP